MDPLSGLEVVTNLRLPGQYDERLLGNLGLQGPYYNWNRWYLPGVGRYLELDPIAAAGGFNGGYGPDWYNYANGNPLRYSDPYGLMSVPDGLKEAFYRALGEWIKELLNMSDLSIGGLGAAVCTQRACGTHHPREFFDAYGDCVEIIGGDFKFALGIEPSDAFVHECADKCESWTHSAQFKKHCEGGHCE